VFHLKDTCGREIVVGPTDKIEIYLKDYRNEVMAGFNVVGQNQIDMNVNEAISTRLIEGVYTLNARFNGTFITTLLKNNKVVVE
jgi:hypothetical protein